MKFYVVLGVGECKTDGQYLCGIFQDHRLANLRVLEVGADPNYEKYHSEILEVETDGLGYVNWERLC